MSRVQVPKSTQVATLINQNAQPFGPLPPEHLRDRRLIDLLPGDAWIIEHPAQASLVARSMGGATAATGLARRRARAPRDLQATTCAS